MTLEILYVGTLPPHPGGSAISCGQLMAGLARRQSIRAVTPVSVDATAAAARFDEAHPELHVQRIPVPFADTIVYLAPDEDYKRAETEGIERVVPELISARRPDVVVIGRESFAWRTTDIAKDYGLPCVQMVRGGLINPIISGQYPPELARHYVERFRLAEVVVVPAYHYVHGLRRLGLDRFEVIRNAVDTNQFTPRSRDDGLACSLGIRRDDVVVATVSNLHPRKQVADFVDAAARTVARNGGLTFVVVGDGPLRGQLEAMCDSAGVSERFRFTGWIDYELMPDYVNLADIVVMTSNAEGLARVYLETQSCERVLIASDIPPASEVVEDGSTGFLFDLGDTGGLADKILLAAADADLRRRVGRAARLRVVERHSLDDAVEAYDDLLRRVVGDGYAR